MKFNESTTVKAHMCDLFVGAASTRPAQLANGLVRTGGKIEGLGWHYLAPAGHDFVGSRLGLIVGRGRELQ